MAMHSPKFKLIDLFCGCGGMTQGFVETGLFDVVFANDYNKEAVQSYKANFDPSGEHTYCGDIIEYLNQKKYTIPTADIVIGGPPCQGFSLLNKNRKNDSRRELWYYFLQVVKQSNAKIAVMENVQQLLSSEEFEQIKKQFNEFGFKYIESRVLIAADFGVPQVRKRAVIIASKESPASLPRPKYINPRKKTLFNCCDIFDNIYFHPWQDVRSAIGNLPTPIGTEIRQKDPPLDLHFGRNPTQKSIERYLAVPLGGNRFDLQKNRPDITPNCWLKKKSGGTDLFGRLWWDRPSVTIRTEFFKPEKGRYLHPDQNRPITHREAARLQSFPDDFIFIGSKIEIARQIGNAVPPLMAKEIAREVINVLENKVDALYVKETRAIYNYIAK